MYADDLLLYCSDQLRPIPTAFDTIPRYNVDFKLFRFFSPGILLSCTNVFPNSSGTRKFLYFIRHQLQLPTGLCAELYTLYTNDYTPAHSSNATIKSADDTAVVGLTPEVEQRTGWCTENNLVLNTTKTKELIVDFRMKKTGHIQPLCISGNYVERVSDFRFLGIQIEEDLLWSANTSVTIKKAQQRLYFLRLLRKNHLSQKHSTTAQ